MRPQSERRQRLPDDGLETLRGETLIEIPCLEEGAQEVDRDRARRADGASLMLLASQGCKWDNGGRGENELVFAEDEGDPAAQCKSRKRRARRLMTARNDAWSPKRFPSMIVTNGT